MKSQKLPSLSHRVELLFQSQILPTRYDIAVPPFSYRFSRNLLQFRCFHVWNFGVLELLGSLELGFWSFDMGLFYTFTELPEPRKVAAQWKLCRFVTAV
jgi:hypothetical protein